MSWKCFAVALAFMDSQCANSSASAEASSPETAACSAGGGLPSPRGAGMPPRSSAKRCREVSEVSCRARRARQALARCARCWLTLSSASIRATAGECSSSTKVCKPPSTSASVKLSLGAAGNGLDARPALALFNQCETLSAQSGWSSTLNPSKAQKEVFLIKRNARCVELGCRPYIAVMASSPMLEDASLFGLSSFKHSCAITLAVNSIGKLPLPSLSETHCTLDMFLAATTPRY
mmetsp:Transcript_41306/g.119520  ORF Transcript_41306/g.119520 Transcript_41306/m.119520 type:complete len:235 (-) Transcript_41306:1121-1825(-)